jgi:hypothetical protein
LRLIVHASIEKIVEGRPKAGEGSFTAKEANAETTKLHLQRNTVYRNEQSSFIADISH